MRIEVEDAGLQVSCGRGVVFFPAGVSRSTVSSRALSSAPAATERGRRQGRRELPQRAQLLSCSTLLSQAFRGFAQRRDPRSEQSTERFVQASCRTLPILAPPAAARVPCCPACLCLAVRRQCWSRACAARSCGSGRGGQFTAVVRWPQTVSQ